MCPVVQDLEKPPLCARAPSFGGLGPVPVAMEIQLASHSLDPELASAGGAGGNPEKRTLFSTELPWRNLSHQPLEQKTPLTSHSRQHPGPGFS